MNSSVHTGPVTSEKLKVKANLFIYLLTYFYLLTYLFVNFKFPFLESLRRSRIWKGSTLEGKEGQQKRQALKQSKVKSACRRATATVLHFISPILCICTCVYMRVKAHMYSAIHVEVSSLLPSCGSQGFNIGHHAQRRAALLVSHLAGPQKSSLMIHMRETNNSMILNTCNYWTQEANAGRVYKLHSETLSLKPNK